MHQSQSTADKIAALAPHLAEVIYSIFIDKSVILVCFLRQIDGDDASSEARTDVHLNSTMNEISCGCELDCLGDLLEFKVRLVSSKWITRGMPSFL